MAIEKPYLLFLGDVHDALRRQRRGRAAEHGLPAADPIRTGVGPLVDRIAQLFGPP